MASSISDLPNYDEESRKQKLLRKSKDAPFVPIGIVGALVGIGYGAYRFRHRGNLSTSLYLIHMRVAAQGTIVSAIGLGIAYSLFKEYVFDKYYHPKPQ